MKSKAIIVLVALTFGVASVSLLSDDRPKKAADNAASDDAVTSDSDKWMAIKLTSSQQIIEHLTRGDFEQLEASARRMLVFNFLEQWHRNVPEPRQSDYQGQLNAFEFATKELVRHAHDQNMEGSLRSYVALTESCVRCHNLIRDVATK